MRTATVFSLLILLLASIGASPSAIAADPPADLNGQVFAIVFLTEKGKPKDTLTFGTDGATAKALGDKPIKVAYVLRKKQKEIEFSGKITDDKGTVTEISGAVSGTDIHGSITTTAKDDDPKARNFTGTRSGNAPAKK